MAADQALCWRVRRTHAKTNTNSGNKYKVPAVLEKIKEHDDNFVLWTPETKAKARAPSRARPIATTRAVSTEHSSSRHALAAA